MEQSDDEGSARRGGGDGVWKEEGHVMDRSQVWSTQAGPGSNSDQ